MARRVCIQPCKIELGSYIPMPGFPGVTVPGIPGAIGGIQSTFSFNVKQTSCDGCEASASLIMQLQPALLSFGIPLCLLGCVFSVVAAVQAVPAAIGGNPGALNSALADTVNKCVCVTQGFGPAAALVWMCTIKGVLCTLIGALNCILSLLSHLSELNAQIAILAADSNIEIQKTAVCLRGVLGVELENLAIRLNPFLILLQIAQYILGIFGSAALGAQPLQDLNDAINTGISTITGLVGTSPELAAFIAAITDLRNALKLGVDVLSIATFGLCPMPTCES